MHQHEERRPTVHQAALRLAGACAVVGSVAVFGFRLAHGDLPADDAPAALRFITEHPAYAGVHLGTILGVLVWVGGFIAFSSTLEHGFARLLGRLGAASVLVGAAIFIVEHSTDGVAGQGLATAWSAASPAAKTDLILSAQTVFTLLRGVSLTGIVVLWGLPLMLFGLAMIREDYPAWLGWTGLAMGATTILGATALLLQRDLFPGVLVYGLLVSVFVQLWSLVLGIVMWRRASAAPRSNRAGEPGAGAVEGCDLVRLPYERSVDG